MVTSRLGAVVATWLVVAVVGCTSGTSEERGEPTGSVAQALAGNGGAGGGISDGGPPPCPNTACSAPDPSGQLAGQCCICNGQQHTYKRHPKLSGWYVCVP